MLKNSVILMLIVALFLPSVAPAYVIDRVEAVVNGEVITKSEVDRAVRTEALRRGVADESGLAFIREEALESLIDRELILGDARRFNIVEVTEKEVEDALASVKARYGSEEEFLRAIEQEEMTVDDLRENLANQILVMKYVDRRIRYFVRVTLDDQKRYYKENKELFGDKSFAEVHGEIHDLLLEKYTDEKLKEYMQDLRSRADIVVNRPEE